MIATSAISITTPERSIVLAPFGEEHIRTILPVPDSLLKYQPASLIPYVKDPNPRKFMHGEEDVEGALSWGIFHVERADARSATREFLGTIALYNKGDNTQEIATSIFRLGFEGKGTGTFAKLGLISLAFDHGVASITSESSTGNYPAHRSLKKAGLVQVGIGNEEYKLGNGTTDHMTQWLLHSETALANAPESEAKAALVAGRQTYLNAVSKVEIEHL